ncbi:phage holin family protein [Timonella senegalensis]|uniref:phage holin family protein n=1 Tax=Timonella senegalensis TaxID=1465825 RepID=UPI000593D7E0|nr:phage holin family protein [Timonella senegalensis]
MDFLKRLLVTAVAFWLTTIFLGNHFDVVGEFQVVAGQDFINRSAVFITVALIFALVNMIVKPITTFLSFPLIVLTLGLFTLVINAAMILLTAWLTESTSWGIQVDGFWWALLAAVLISFMSAVGRSILGLDKPKR